MHAVHNFTSYVLIVRLSCQKVNFAAFSLWRSSRLDLDLILRFYLLCFLWWCYRLMLGCYLSLADLLLLIIFFYLFLTREVLWKTCITLLKPNLLFFLFVLSNYNTVNVDLDFRQALFLRGVAPPWKINTFEHAPMLLDNLRLHSVSSELAYVVYRQLSIRTNWWRFFEWKAAIISY